VAERVLMGDGMTVHQGRAVCTVCGGQVGLNLSGMVTAHFVASEFRESNDAKETGT
jgi:hypothetical protein